MTVEVVHVCFHFVGSRVRTYVRACVSCSEGDSIGVVRHMKLSGLFGEFVNEDDWLLCFRVDNWKNNILP